MTQETPPPTTHHYVTATAIDVFRDHLLAYRDRTQKLAEEAGQTRPLHGSGFAVYSSSSREQAEDESWYRGAAEAYAHVLNDFVRWINAQPTSECPSVRCWFAEKAGEPCPGIYPD